MAVVGGGNSAAADALALSRIAQKVYLIHRRDSLRATKVYHEPLMNAPNVEFCWNSTVSALLHDSRLTGLRLKDVNTDAEHDLACDGVFISVGRAPATKLFRRELAMQINASDACSGSLAFICKRLRLNYKKLSEEEKKWLKKISEKSDLLKNPNPQRGKRG